MNSRTSIKQLRFSDKQLGDLDFSVLDNASNFKLLQKKSYEEKNGRNAILDATRSEENSLLLTESECY